MKLIRNTVYYTVKPWMPRRARLSFRRWYSRRKRAQVEGVWPILPGSERPPADWPGWPGGKQFAVVLTHDVEGPLGLSRCRELMEVERKLGFRSSFNFIPEGPYQVSADLREHLVREGFEVGVHDLHHDGKLYRSRRAFARNAERINRYLREWQAVGFRSGFMLHNLEWAHELNILYEASTFDTDPFEPQPDGVGTIFPFWVPRAPEGRVQNAECRTTLAGSRIGEGKVRASNTDAAISAPSPAGYVELPYTLVQDSTLFLLLAERTPDIWFHKVDWLARNGGMVLVDTHPDYAAMNGAVDPSWEYPVKLYASLLEYIRSRYAGAYWHAAPAEVAKWYKSTLAGTHGEPTARAKEGEEERVNCSAAPSAEQLAATGEDLRGRTGMASVISAGKSHGSGGTRRKPKIWVDLDNTPHVPFFEPILEELRARGFPLLVTARDAFQVCELADKKGLQYTRVGRHYGKNMLLKGAGLVYRSAQLAPLVLRERPALGVSHGARSQLLLANCLRLPTVLIEDYEYCRFAPMAVPTWLMTPDVIPDSALQRDDVPVRKYPGIKEDVYAWRLKPDAGVLKLLGLSDSDLIVTIRPPATEAHYHNPESEKLFDEVMTRTSRTPGVRIVLLPRNQKQGESIRRNHPDWFRDGTTVIPPSAVDGMNLVWHSDLVVSGGGTMNREAAALGVPVYSIFRGTIGAVDRHLQSEGRLVLLETKDDVHRKLRLVRKTRKPLEEVTSKQTLQHIVDTIEELVSEAVPASR